jgi:4-carboxymuconolactone decarboxylase
MTYLPGVYKEFKQEFPEIAKAYDALAVKCHGWGSLDAKTRRLIKLGIAIGLSSEGGVRSHARRALEGCISGVYHGWFPQHDCCYEMGR